MSPSGDVKFEELTLNWTKAQPVVSSFITSVEPSIQSADDILQEVALAVVRKYDTYRTDSSFIAWTIGIAKNEILKHRRKNARDRHVFDEELVEKIATVYQEKSNDLPEMKTALENCISKLQAHGQKILKMRYSWGLEVGQIAKQLGTTSNSAFVALHRIRMALRKCIVRQLKMAKI